MAVASSNARIGSSFDEFLKEEDMLGNAVGLALLRVFAWKIREAMKAKAITKVEMVKRMKASSSEVDRLLDPTSDKVELATLVRAADAVGHKLSIDLVA